MIVINAKVQHEPVDVLDMYIFDICGFVWKRNKPDSNGLSSCSALRGPGHIPHLWQTHVHLSPLRNRTTVMITKADEACFSIGFSMVIKEVLCAFHCDGDGVGKNIFLGQNEENTPFSYPQCGVGRLITYRSSNIGPHFPPIWMFVKWILGDRVAGHGRRYPDFWVAIRWNAFLQSGPWRLLANEVGVLK